MTITIRNAHNLIRQYDVLTIDVTVLYIDKFIEYNLLRKI